MTVCDLCELPLGPEAVTTDTAKYCCSGCRHVDQVLDDVTVDGERQPSSEQPIDGPTAFFDVGGMHCATCEIFIERALAEQPDVTAVDASYATEAVRVGHDGDLDFERIRERLGRWGYEVAERDAGEAPAGDDGVVPRLLIGIIFGMMTMVWYVLGLYPTYFGYDPILADLYGLDGRYLLANIWVMTTIVLIYTGGPILRGAAVALRARQPSMDLLVALAAVGAYTYSAAAVLVGRTDIYFDITVAVVLVVTVGRAYEDRIRSSATSLIGELTALRVDSATTHPAGDRVAVDELTAGSTVIVKPGERIPLDSQVVEGTAAVDESLLTGALTPRERGPGDRVAGGTVVTDEPLVVEIDAPDASALDRIVDRLWHIQTTRPGVQQLATRLAVLFVPLVVAIGTLAAFVTIATGGGPTTALLVGLTVVIVSCPCALGLATPLAIARGVKAAATRGIVLTAASVIETAPDVETVVFDKTGTLTGGEFTLEAVVGDERALSRAAALEHRSNHPIAKAVVDAVGAEPLPVATDVRRLDRGMVGRVDETLTTIGDRRTMVEREITIPDEFAEAADTGRSTGQTPVFVAWQGRVEGVLLLEDRPRTAWKPVLHALDDDHRIIVLTGDDEAATERFRRSPAVDRVFSGVPPEAKAETIARLRAEGPVAMVGDGTNDAPALAAADLGIALQSGTELAVDAADAVILGDDLEAVPALFDHAAAMRTRVRQNLGWAFTYNAVAIPVAAAGLLNPLIAAVAMVSSSLLVVTNSARTFGVEQTPGQSRRLGLVLPTEQTPE